MLKFDIKKPQFALRFLPTPSRTSPSAWSPTPLTALIGPRAAAKYAAQTLNRMNDLIEGIKIEGSVKLDGEEIYGGMDVNLLRKRVGMVFQKPNPFPMSVYDNIAFGPRTHGIHARARLNDIVEKSLRGAAIWDEVKDRLKRAPSASPAASSSDLCIARALAVEPEVHFDGRADFRP